jgi:hypothetical protein
MVGLYYQRQVKSAQYDNEEGAAANPAVPMTTTSSPY